MGRKPRIQFEGATYHVCARGNNQRVIYLDDRDRELFLWHLRDAIHTHEWSCHAYCLMGNHFHAVVETPLGNLSAGMCRLNGTYARRFNRRHGWSNHLLGNRYVASLIETDEYFLEACRYTVLNPVRAQLCETPEEWRWSNFRSTAGLARVPEWLDVEHTLRCFSADSTVARERYAEFVRAGAASRDGLLVVA